MNIKIDTKTAIVLIVWAGALVLAWTGKITWTELKEVLAWTIGPYVLGQSYENAQRHAATVRAGAAIALLEEKRASSAPAPSTESEKEEPKVL